MASLVATAQTGDAQLEDLRSKLDGLLRDADAYGKIREALDVFREVTLQTTRRAQETADTVGDLADHAEGLEREIGRFRI